MTSTPKAASASVAEHDIGVVLGFLVIGQTNPIVVDAFARIVDRARLAAPAASAEPVAEVYRGGTNTFGRATVLNRWLDGAMELADGTHLLYAHPATGTAEPVESLCDDCPPVGYPTEKTRCLPCPRRVAAPHPDTAAGEQELPALPEPLGRVFHDGDEHEESWISTSDAYTEDQMRTYAQSALAARRLPAGGWQPIETAPKNGTIVDLWLNCNDGHRRETNAYFVKDHSDTITRYTADGEYTTSHVRRDGWWAPNHDYDGADGFCETPRWFNEHPKQRKWIFAEPTHWMPLPSPPPLAATPAQAGEGAA